MPDSEGNCYLAREPDCGCAIAVVVDAPEHKRDTGTEVARWIRQGLTIEQVTVEAVRSMRFGCEHRKAAEPKRRKAG